MDPARNLDDPSLRVAEPAQILVVDDDPNLLQSLSRLLADASYRVVTTDCLAGARAILGKERIDLILTDKNLLDGSGVDLARELASAPRDCEILLMTGYASVDSAIEAMRCGVSDYLEKPLEREPLLARIARALERLARKQADRRLIEELRRKNAALEELTNIDPLTHLHNHAYFQESLDREVCRAARQESALSVVLLDLDGFKAINDSLGHGTGDEVLESFAESLRGRNRRITDLAFRLRENDVAARYGGDEFALILPDTTKLGAAVLAERMREQFARTQLHETQAITLTLSIGVAGFPDDARDRDGLLEAADVALYAAKATGKNRVVSFAPGLSRSPSSRASVARKQAQNLEALSSSMERRAFRFAYQPIVEITDWRVHGYEALCRPSDERFRNPLELFRAAEDAGQISPLGRVLRELCVEPLADLAAPGVLFVNLHPHELNDVQLLESETALRRHAGRIVFEITEAAEMQNLGRTRDVLAKLRAQGYKIALDDLGAGYSSLNLLALLEPDYVKLDIEMVRSIRTSARTGRLVTHLLDFARGENIEVVAEGIETADEYQAVRALGVKLMQGYYFARPAPPFATVGPRPQ